MGVVTVVAYALSGMLLGVWMSTSAEDLAEPALVLVYFLVKIGKLSHEWKGYIHKGNRTDMLHEYACHVDVHVDLQKKKTFS